MENENRIIRPSRENVLAKVVADEAILINVKTGTYYSLNGIGGRVWQWIENEKSIGEMVSALTQDYDVTEENALKDIGGLLAELSNEGLIKISSGETTVKRPVSATNSSGRTPYETPKLDILETCKTSWP